MKKSNTLQLSRKRQLKHYAIVIWLAVASILFFLSQVWQAWKTTDFDVYTASIKGMTFLGLTLLLFIYQHQKLSFTTIQSRGSRKQNLDKAKAAIKKLNWTLKVENGNHVEAFQTAKKSTWTWGHEMISIVIADDEVSVNSICNVDIKRTQAFLSFGQNRANVAAFMKAMEEV